MNSPAQLFANRQQLDQALADTVAALLRHAIAHRGRATLVVSGGSTPLNFFRCLSLLPLAWERVTVLLADERWVPADHPDSNEKLVRDNLLVNAAAAAGLQSLKTADDDPRQAEDALNAMLAAMGRFDLVILGMGGDGHTASLFPGAEMLAQGLDTSSGRQCLAVTPPAAPHRRISLTLARLLDSEQIFIHITGADKKQIFDRAVQHNDPARLPIAAVLHQQDTPVTLYFAP